MWAPSTRSRLSRRPRAILAAVAAAALLLTTAAHGACPRRLAATATGPPSVLLVMDASKSMASPAGDGRTRLQAAKASLRTLIDGLPNNARVGLRLYGHRVSGAGRARGCRDTQLVAPVGALDRIEMKRQIDAYRAVGSTPIARALRAAAGDLPATGNASIVLVSDGGDNCAPPDPCRVAADIVAADPRVSIQTIGFQVSGRARDQLRCIAARGRGVFRAASDTEDLALALRALSARAMRSFRPAGRPIAGGSSARDATRIGTGRFVDAVGPGEERWYSIAIGRGQRLAATAVLVSPCPVDHRVADMIGTALGLDVVGPAGLPAQRTGDSSLFLGDESVESAGLLTPRIGLDRVRFAGFARPGRYGLRFTLSDNGLAGLRRAFAGARLPLQIETRLIGGGSADASSARSAPAPVSADAADSADRVALRLGVALAIGMLVGLLIMRARLRGRA